ncbi:hypothetical protein B0T11DRAFT_326211 [Plectosphaerella cucumerina]|uniref:NADP-dependent oxidoreductase domain-containing protein n=1 Tax=Plectosphaerella cucumerina TaxID=40658 RepID=A0A8K0TJM9_9PEZI|nr:hypothetical protein B0T11DRAFT_326211 [Plectosphaerella cucumerina]
MTDCPKVRHARTPIRNTWEAFEELRNAGLVKNIGIHVSMLQIGQLMAWQCSRKERMSENLDVVGFDLEEEELKDIVAVDMGLHFNDPGVYLPGQPLRLLT